jgi:diaminohydroxyphosphoribosylaminopyrimidine deaminase/5-amino-6-(5-phosphoribosylamino)uracil reductase
LSPSEQDREFMAHALSLAEKGRGLVEPNPMVGAVVVEDGRVVGEGFYKRFGGPHAEVQALRQAGGRARGAMMYVTLEPCDHEGKTPPCAPLVAESGLRRVVICTLDPTAAEPAGGTRLLAGHGLAVEVGLCREEAARLNAGFFKLAATGRPLVMAKWAMTADGKLASASGSSRWISSPPSRHLVHRVRGQVDCVMVGARTATLDDPLLTCRDAELRRAAARLVVCGGSAPAAESRLVQTAAETPVLLAHAAGRPPDGLERLVELGCEALAVEPHADEPSRVDLGALLDELGRRRMTNVLVEGGGELLGALFDAGLVDRVMAFVAPLILGGATATTPVAGHGVANVDEGLRLRQCRSEQVGPDLLLEGWADDPTRWVPQEPGSPAE